MKTLIVALNSKYIHASLAPWYLKASCGDECGEVKVREFTINDSADGILSSIYKERADVTAFSCYIWNISHVLSLVENLKAVLPDTRIVLGGPEVSFDSENVICSSPGVDYIICGEGEETFRLLLRQLYDMNMCNVGKTDSGESFRSLEIDEIDGLVCRTGNDTAIKSSCRSDKASYRIVENLDSIPSPYSEEMLSQLQGRIVYYESSRGCPYACSYCLSSTYSGVRYFSMERVKCDLKKLMRAGLKQVKFVDRTFNANRARAKEIFAFILENAEESGTNFHFEAAADLFDDAMLDMLSGVPAGLFQLEIGIQTVNSRALAEVDRKTDLDRAFSNIRRLIDTGKLHIHLDLIAGLPFEDFRSFKASFNCVYGLKPHKLQLGFLKMLKGSRIREEAEKHGYSFRRCPPYEVFFNRYLSFDDILVLKGVEDLVERYYNTGRFAKSLDYIIGHFFESPFDFYTELYRHYKEQGYYSRSISSREAYSILLEFVKYISPDEGYGFRDEGQTIRDEGRRLKGKGHRLMLAELLRLDFLASDNSGNLPEGLGTSPASGFKERCFDFLRDEKNVRGYLPGYAGQPAKQIFKQVRFEQFNADITLANPEWHTAGEETIMLFDYGARDRVTGRYRCRKVRL